jgi:hypothetical protein
MHGPLASHYPDDFCCCCKRNSYTSTCSALKPSGSCSCATRTTSQPPGSAAAAARRQRLPQVVGARLKGCQDACAPWCGEGCDGRHEAAAAGTGAVWVCCVCVGEEGQGVMREVEKGAVGSSASTGHQRFPVLAVKAKRVRALVWMLYRFL